MNIEGDEPPPTQQEPNMPTKTRAPKLVDYNTTEVIRDATEEEARESREAAKTDGGAGVIEVDGRSCYVED